jgi:hypothetical protein
LTTEPEVPPLSAEEIAKWTTWFRGIVETYRDGDTAQLGASALRNAARAFDATIAAKDAEIAKGERDYWELHAGLTAELAYQSDIIRAVSEIVQHTGGSATLWQTVAATVARIAELEAVQRTCICTDTGLCAYHDEKFIRPLQEEIGALQSKLRDANRRASELFDELGAKLRDRDAEIAELHANAELMKFMEAQMLQRFANNPDAHNWMGWRTQPDDEGRQFDLTVQLVSGEMALDRYVVLEAMLREAEARIALLLQGDQPWPLTDVLARLADFAHLQLTRDSFDGHGHESLALCVARARQLLAALQSAQKGNEPK